MVVNEPASLQSLNPLLVEPVEVRVIDVSFHGLALQVSHPLAPQSEVKVRRGSEIVFGEVRYCVPIPGGFRAGIKVRETLPTTSIE